MPQLLLSYMASPFHLLRPKNNQPMTNLTDHEKQLAKEYHCPEEAMLLVKNAFDAEFFRCADDIRLVSDGPQQTYESTDPESKERYLQLARQYPEFQKSIHDLIDNSKALLTQMSKPVSGKATLGVRYIRQTDQKTGRLKSDQDKFLKLAEELQAFNCDIMDMGTVVIGKKFLNKADAENYLQERNYPSNDIYLTQLQANKRRFFYPSPITLYPHDAELAAKAEKGIFPKLTPEQVERVLEYLPGIANEEEHLRFFRKCLLRGKEEIENGDEAVVLTLKTIRHTLKPFGPGFYKNAHIFPESTLERLADDLWEISTPDVYAAMIPHNIARIKSSAGFLKDIVKAGTNGINYGITPSKLLDKLTEWNSQWGPLTITNVTGESFKIVFESPPETEQHKLILDVIQLCPLVGPSKVLIEQYEHIAGRLQNKQPILIGWD